MMRQVKEVRHLDDKPKDDNENLGEQSKTDEGKDERFYSEINREEEDEDLEEEGK